MYTHTFPLILFNHTVLCTFLLYSLHFYCTGCQPCLPGCSAHWCVVARAELPPRCQFPMGNGHQPEQAINCVQAAELRFWPVLRSDSDLHEWKGCKLKGCLNEAIQFTICLDKIVGGLSNLWASRNVWERWSNNQTCSVQFNVCRNQSGGDSVLEYLVNLLKQSYRDSASWWAGDNQQLLH